MAWLHYRRQPLESQHQQCRSQPGCQPQPGVPAAALPAAPLVAQPQMQLAPFQPVDAGAARNDAAGPIGESEAHGLDGDLPVEPRGTDIAVAPDESLPQASGQAIGTEPAVVWPTKQQMGITRNMEPKY